MILAIVNGLLTGIELESFIMLKTGINMIESTETALATSVVSMIIIAAAMNSMDWWLTGDATSICWMIPILLAVGCLTPRSYNYRRLKKWGKASLTEERSC